MKIISFLLIIVLLFSFASCAESIESGSDLFESKTEATLNSTEASTEGFTEKATDSDSNADNSMLDGDSNVTDSPTDIAPHVHSYNSVVTEPTVTADGYTTYTCECGDSYVADIVPKKIEIPLISNGVSLAKIVLPTEASRCTLYARDRLQLSVSNATGVTLAEDGDGAFEILIGNTGREESSALLATLGADEYAIKLTSDKLVIVASNEAFLYEAAKYFADNYLKEPYATVGEGTVTLLTDDLSVTCEGDKTSMHYLISLETNPTANGIAFQTLDNQLYGVNDADPRIYRRQGGCYTGENYYQVFISKNEEIAVIGKKNIATGELIYSEPRVMLHANDATYNPYTNRLIVGNTKTIWIYDGDTLDFIESIELAHTTSRISYCAERHTYILGSYYFYDDSFTYTNKYFKGSLSTLSGGISLTSQGTTCDDTFIYSLVFNGSSGAYNAYIGVYDWYGNLVAFVTVLIPGSFEPENISVVNGKLYISACSTQPVATLYEVEFNV